MLSVFNIDIGEGLPRILLLSRLWDCYVLFLSNVNFVGSTPSYLLIDIYIAVDSVPYVLWSSVLFLLSVLTYMSACIDPGSLASASHLHHIHTWVLIVVALGYGRPFSSCIIMELNVHSSCVVYIFEYDYRANGVVLGSRRSLPQTSVNE
jgi:hypothetical protein